jgi:glycolate oxidase FAD binding subunit
MTETFAPERVPTDPAHFEIGGVPPRELVRPATREEVSEILKRATRDRLSVVPWGGGMWLPNERAPEKYDLALDLSGVDRIVEYEPDDLTVTVECGVTIERLRNRLAEHGQELPLEAPRPGRATVGGVIASNTSGPRRYRFGSPRDRILGATLVLGDGTIARTGGKVVKNVAGYAVHRLACGSRGALFAIVEMSFKLMPAPAARRLLIYDVDARALAEPGRWQFLTRLGPAAVTVTQEPDADEAAPFSVQIGLEDDEAWVTEQEARVNAALGAPSGRVDGENTAQFWASTLSLQWRMPSLTFTTAGNTPAALAPVIEAGAEDLIFHAPAGRLHVFGVGADPGAFIERMTANGFLLIDAAGYDFASSPPEIAIPALRARVRDAIDPGHVFAYGDRWSS